MVYRKANVQKFGESGSVKAFQNLGDLKIDFSTFCSKHLQVREQRTTSFGTVKIPSRSRIFLVKYANRQRIFHWNI
jgi:hypothetical protein